MKVTSIKIYPFDTSGIGGRLRGMAEIVLDDQFVVKGIKIVQAKNGGYFISYPSCKIRGKYYDIIVPVNNKVDREIRRAIMDEFKEKVLNCS